MESCKQNNENLQCASISEFEQRHHSDFKNIQILEKKLAELLQSRGSFDPAVRGARLSLRDSYQQLLFQTLENSLLAYASDFQQALWRLHYIGIEEFRTKIRNLSPSPNNRRNSKNEPLLRVVNSFKGFLDEASGYFHGLIVKLRAKYGLPPAVSPGEGLMCLRKSGYEGSNHCAVLCQRVLICLGDLARYKELFAVQNAKNRDWTVAANYYKQAAGLCPSNGNPYNQLAVLATYNGDALSAIYHYCRSLAVDAPFVTARENLTLLLEKKRQHACKVSFTAEGPEQLPYLIAAAEKEGLSFRGSSYHKGNPEQMTEGASTAMAIKELWECFQVHFMQILGAVLTKSCIEELEDAVSKSENVLQQFFSHSILELEMTFPSKTSYQSGGNIVRSIPVLEVIVIVIFLIHDTHKPVQNDVTTSGTSKVPILFSFCCFLVSLLVTQAKKSEDNGLNHLLPGAIIFMEWFASQSSILNEIKIGSAVVKGLLNLKQEADMLRTVLSNQLTSPGKNIPYAVLNIPSKATYQTAIWEDYEMLGFSPLSSYHQSLDFSNLCMTKDSDESLYVMRYIGAFNAFSSCMESKRGFLDTHNQYEVIDCDAKRDAISLDHVHQLEETSFIGDGNECSSLKDWVQSSSKTLVPVDLHLVSEKGKIPDVDEDPSTVLLSVENDQHSKEDCSVSIEKSYADLPDNSKRQAGSEFALEDSLVCTPDHLAQSVSPSKDGEQPDNSKSQAGSKFALEDSLVCAPDHLAQPVSPSKDGKQSKHSLDQAKDSLFQNMEETLERPQEALFSTENTKNPISCEDTPTEKVLPPLDQTPIAIGCPHCGRELNISDVVAKCLQTEREAVRGVSLSRKCLKHIVSPCHAADVWEKESKRTTEDMTNIASANKCVEQRSFYSSKGGYSQIFSNVKTCPENTRWLDEYTHIKPSFVKGTCTGLYPSFPIFSCGSKRKRADTGIYNMILNYQEMKQYKTKNPFVRSSNCQFYKAQAND